MRVLLLGGTGRVGAFAARRLAASDIISKVTIDGRNRDALARVMAEVGRARYTCWPVRVPISSTIFLTIATLRILRGEVSGRGVLSPEACFEPTLFFEEAAQYAKEEDRNKPLLGESLEWLS